MIYPSITVAHTPGMAGWHTDVARAPARSPAGCMHMPVGPVGHSAASGERYAPPLSPPSLAAQPRMPFVLALAISCPLMAHTSWGVSWRCCAMQSTSGHLAGLASIAMAQRRRRRGYRGARGGMGTAEGGRSRLATPSPRRSCLEAV